MARRRLGRPPASASCAAASKLSSSTKAPNRTTTTASQRLTMPGTVPSTARRPSTSSTISIAASSIATTKPSTSERNIDNVVLGDVLFRAWYPSFYLKEIIGKEVVEGKAQMLERLYVCKHCFRYSKELVSFVGHVRACARRFGGAEDMVPGRRVYVHGKGRGKEEGVWSVWEVDGEVDDLYCQNLSLFAKLFLDNKSVFFDVTCFFYFLLVHTAASGEQQVVGFFSKEKMSWDNNNLACILIFPPWQRKGLGALLIAVSYEISRREQILGGPEKPISNLGKRGYLRFWSGEVARWLLAYEERSGKKGAHVDLEMLSRGTWIAVDDCLAALRDMDVAVPVGKKGKVEDVKVRIDKVRIREWAAANGVGLEPVIDERGMLEGYGYREVVDEEMGE